MYIIKITGRWPRRPERGDRDHEPVPEGTRRHRDLLRGGLRGEPHHVGRGEEAEADEDAATATAHVDAAAAATAE